MQMWEPISERRPWWSFNLPNHRRTECDPCGLDIFPCFDRQRVSHGLVKAIKQQLDVLLSP